MCNFQGELNGCTGPSSEMRLENGGAGRDEKLRKFSGLM